MERLSLHPLLWKEIRRKSQGCLGLRTDVVLQLTVGGFFSSFAITFATIGTVSTVGKAINIFCLNVFHKILTFLQAKLLKEIIVHLEE